MGTYLRVLHESYPMDTNMTGFKLFLKIIVFCALDEIGHRIGRVKLYSEN